MTHFGDWYCTNCKFNIFRTKLYCSKCNAKKPDPPNNLINTDYQNLANKVLEEVNKESRVIHEKRKNEIIRVLDFNTKKNL